ncbi:unnamed protein product [Prorocentrum cordatum]|uniref:Uncharacterized protein n=1 Tax=Prorocentrum cordatum TaxID=2364126 RepID=A0ABN9WAI2_9DINO|nr:unnamed protein product [Polarella glacialis]
MLVPYAPVASARLAQVNVSARRAPLGAHPASCDPDSKHPEQRGMWCLSACPAGFEPSGGTNCVQACGGGFPAEGMGVCGVNQGELVIATTEMVSMVANGAIESYLLISDMKDRDGRARRQALCHDRRVHRHGEALCPAAVPRGGAVGPRPLPGPPRPSPEGGPRRSTGDMPDLTMTTAPPRAGARACGGCLCRAWRGCKGACPSLPSRLCRLLPTPRLFSEKGRRRHPPVHQLSPFKQWRSVLACLPNNVLRTF